MEIIDTKISTTWRVFSRCIKLLALASTLILLTASNSYSQEESEDRTKFLAKVTVQLCKGASSGASQLEFTYRIGSDPTRHPLQIVGQTLGGTLGEFQFYVPRTLAYVPFHIEAQCRNAFGYGGLSNAITTSNCEFLALEDTDADGLPNSAEDTNCDNFFSPGDASNPDNVDSDGDGVRDLVEYTFRTEPTNPGSSPRPYIYSSGKFDPDGDGNANPVAWRPSTGVWYIKDFITPGNNLGIPFGLAGDTPFTYQPEGKASTLGVIRTYGTDLTWLASGPGMKVGPSKNHNQFKFGLFGDNIVLGPWEKKGVTAPAVARLFNGYWTFFIHKSDGTIRQEVWGGNGDIPKVQDYDGDGLFDVAVFRPSEQKTYVIRSTDGGAAIYNFGSGTADHTVRGDYTGDGVDDITLWEPQTGIFTTLVSEEGFRDDLAKTVGAPYMEAMQLGLYFVHLPINWNIQNGITLYTVVDHATGFRYWRPNNDPAAAPEVLQWGVAGDALG